LMDKLMPKLYYSNANTEISYRERSLEPV